MAEEITTEDVQAVVDKLEEWGNALPPKERVVLRRILSEALESDDEVEGFAFGAPFEFQPGATSPIGRLGQGMSPAGDGMFIQLGGGPNMPGMM